MMSKWRLVPAAPTNEMAASMKPLTDGPPTHRWGWIYGELLRNSPSPADDAELVEEVADTIENHDNALSAAKAVLYLLSGEGE